MNPNQLNSTIDTFYNFIVGSTIAMGAVSALNFLVGGVDKYLIACAVFMTVDYATGVMAGFTAKRVSSKRAWLGLKKKGGMLLLVVVASTLDYMLGSDNIMRNATLFYLVGMEGLSILENLEKLGVKFPVFLKDRFEQMTTNSEREMYKSNQTKDGK